jgi:Protein of unknown function (DUF968).
MSIIITGRITAIHPDGQLTLSAPCPDMGRLVRQRWDSVVIEIPDGRRLSHEQRKKAHALIGEIAEWAGYAPEWMKRHMKVEFVAERLESLERKMFSLADCDMTVAREFISFLIEFVLMHGIPTRVPLMELCEDIEHYVYHCLIHRKCAVCGDHAQLHHWQAIGAGRDRTEVPQLGWPVISLCGEHHGVAHTKGRTWLEDDMHLVPVPLDEKIAKVYKLAKKARRPKE